MVKVFDPLLAQEALKAERELAGDTTTSRQVARASKARAKKAIKQADAAPVTEDLLKSDFRQFLIVLWRFLLGVDPSPAMLDMAWFLQHGPDRSVIMAFRGFSKSWITGAFAMWLLYRDPQEKVMVVSGSLARAVATTSWCLSVIKAWPVLAHLTPKPDQRQSSKAFDVGPATPEQSPSFHALGIGGQVVGFRASCIIPDDVETQQNSLTVTMREKNAEAVKEFDSVIKPGGVIKFLGTPHDEDSLYSHLGARGYTVRVWPALYPTEKQAKVYGDKLAPWVTQQIRKLGPSCIGTSIMPTRFTDDDLAKRKLSLGSAEFALQFMLDTSLSDRDKYPLKLRDLMVMSLDDRKGPESLVWSQNLESRLTDLPSFGFEGDHYYAPILPPNVSYAPYNVIIGALDNSGRGSDETALTIFAELGGNLYLLYLGAWEAGYEPPTLQAIAEACVKYRVQRLRVEGNFGDGMFTTLLRPVLEKAWKLANDGARKLGRPLSEQDGGTAIDEVKVGNQMAKERRMLRLLEPVTQQHRLIVSRKVIEWDYASIQGREGSDTAHRYSLFHQYTHLTREPDSLKHDDRLDASSLGIMAFAEMLGVDPDEMAKVMQRDRDDEEWERLMGDTEEDENGLPSGRPREGKRATALLPQAR